MIEKKELIVKSVVLTAFVFYDKDSDLYTITLKGKGGPVISSKNKKTALKNFEEALNLSCAVQNLLVYNEYIIDMGKINADNISSSKLMNKHSIKYLDLVA